MADYFGIYEWLSQHIAVGGWLLVLGVTWKIGGWFHVLSRRATEGEKILNLIATNHLPHLQATMTELTQSNIESKEAIVSELRGIRSDLFQLALKDDTRP